MWLLKVSVNLTGDFNIFTNIVTDSPVLLWRTSSEMFFKKAFREDAVNLASVQMSCINRVASLSIYKSSCLQNVYKIGVLKNFAKSTETSAQVFSCGFCEINIFPRAFSIDRVTASGYKSFARRFVLLYIYCMVWRTAFLKSRLGGRDCSCVCSLAEKNELHEFLKRSFKAKECFLRKGTTFQSTPSLNLFIIFSRISKDSNVLSLNVASRS